MYLGLVWYWWFIWFFLLILFFGFLGPSARHRIRETPLETLQRAYASGRLTTQEYEERRARLLRDQPARAEAHR